MKLEYPKYSDSIKTALQNKFGGFDRSPDPSEGRLSEVLNTTADKAPRISSAPPRSEFMGAREVYSFFDDLTQRWFEKQGGEGSYKDKMKKLIPVIEGVFDVADRVFYLLSSVDPAADLHTGGAGMLSVRCACYDEGSGSVAYSSPVAPYSGAGVRAVVFNRRLVVWIDGDGSASCPDRVVSFEYTPSETEGEPGWIGQSPVSLEFPVAAGIIYHEITEAATYIGCSAPLEGVNEGDVVCVLLEDDAGKVAEEFIYVRRLYTTEPGGCVIETDYNQLLPATAESLELLEQGSTERPLSLTVTRPVPRLEHLAVNRDRIWGTAGNEIFSCASCDPNNWYNYRYNASDAFTAQIPAVSRFTAVCSYMGSVYFFTREGAYRMYGTTPEVFMISEISCLGCPEGNEVTFAVAGGLAFYCSEQGPACFDGEGSTLIAYPFGETLPLGRCALGAGGVYYLGDGEYVYVFDTASRSWHRLSGDGVCSLLCINGREVLFYADGGAQYLSARRDEERIVQSSFAETGTFTDGCIYGVFPVEFTLRARLGADSRLSLSVSADGSDWQQILLIDKKGEHVCSAHYLPRVRADGYRIRLDGYGEWQVYSIARSYIPAPRSN